MGKQGIIFLCFRLAFVMLEIRFAYMHNKTAYETLVLVHKTHPSPGVPNYFSGLEFIKYELFTSIYIHMPVRLRYIMQVT